MSLVTTMLLTGPLMTADAIVVLCGQDIEPRLNVGKELLWKGAASRLVLTGGVTGPGVTDAEAAKAILMGKGVGSDRIETDGTAQNTKQQMDVVCGWAADRGWQRLLVVASPYHIERAIRTGIATLTRIGHDQSVRLVPVPCSQAPWNQPPDGLTALRMRLYLEECEKMARYGADVADDAMTTQYLTYWEGQ